MPNPYKHNLEMNNYEKAKEEGIKSFREQFPAPIKIVVNVGGDTDEVDLMELLEDHLSSFAEKIKEGVKKDIESKLRAYFDGLIHIPSPQATLENILETLLASNSQTIKE